MPVTLLVSGRSAVEMALRSASDRVEEVLSVRPLDQMGLPSTHAPTRVVDRPRLDALVERPVAHGGVVARVRPPACDGLPSLTRAAVDSRRPLVVLDGVTDPRNLGAILRVAAWYGSPGVVVPARNSAPLNAAAVKASAGAAAAIPVLRVPNVARALDACGKAGLWVYAAAAGPESQATRVAPRNLPAVLVLGDEGSGIRPGVLRRAEVRVRIDGHPPAGLDSLNVAAAAAVLLDWLRDDP